jgi:hypothetical protein
MNKKIILSLCIMLIIILNSNAQTFDLRFNVVNSDESNFDVQVQIKSSSTFKLAASNITFDYNTLAISNPSLLSAQNYTGVGGSPLHIYSDLTVTQPNNGIASVNVTYLQSDDSYATEVPVAWTDVAVVRFNVVNAGNLPNLVFRTSGLSPTAIYKIEMHTTTLLSSGDLAAYNGPMPVELTSFTASLMNNNVILNWQTATEINNFGFDVERLAYRMAGKPETGDWRKIGFVKGNGNSNSIKEYVFKDKNLKPGNYCYRLKQIDNDGKYEYSKQVEVSIIEIQPEFVLSQNYPNPFNPITRIEYSIPNTGISFMKSIQLIVYDVLGREIATLVNEKKSAGIYSVTWNAAEFPSGIYIYRLVSNGEIITKIMNLIK